MEVGSPKVMSAHISIWSHVQKDEEQAYELLRPAFLLISLYLKAPITAGWPAGESIIEAKLTPENG